MADPFLVSAAPEEVGVSSSQLRELSEWIRAEELDVRAMVLLRHDRLVLEWYAGGVSREHNHNVFSITKSIVATLIGAAIQEGELSGVDLTVADVFPDSAQRDPQLSAISLEQLLSMRSGLPVSRGNQVSGPSRDLFDELHTASDRTKSVLQLNLERSPGSKFAYSNVDPQLALAILSHASQEGAWEHFTSKLLGPLEMKNAGWLYADDKGLHPGGYGLRMRAIDLAKVGQLYLQQGRWKKRQLLSESYVRAATSDQTGTGYGYDWWVSKQGDLTGTFSAKGVRGQQVLVDPQRDTVFVLLSDIEPTHVKKVTRSVSKRVLNAVQTQALPSNPTAVRALQKELQQASTYTPARRSEIPRARLPWPPEVR